MKVEEQSPGWIKQLIQLVQPHIQVQEQESACSRIVSMTIGLLQNSKNRNQLALQNSKYDNWFSLEQ